MEFLYLFIFLLFIVWFDGEVKKKGGTTTTTLFTVASILLIAGLSAWMH